MIAAAGAPLLSVEGLTVAPREAPDRPIVADAALSVGRGRALGIVSESGCGKSLTCLAVMGLLPGALVRTAGRVRLDDMDLEASGRAGVRGRRIAMVFQDPAASLNPLRRMGAFLAGLLRLHRGLGWRDARDGAVHLLGVVGMPAPRDRLRAHPHELSGGQNQRVMTAGALAGEPELLLADEATTALDVTTQAQILSRLADLRRERGMGLVVVSHDLGVIAEAADDVAVMYAGRVVERAPAPALFRGPRHPYAAGLVASIPPERGRAPLYAMPGLPPTGGAALGSCAFAPRCARATSLCRTALPPLHGDDGRAVACHHPLGGR